MNPSPAAVITSWDLRHVRPRTWGHMARVWSMNTFIHCVHASVSSATVQTLQYCLMLSSAVFLTSCASWRRLQNRVWTGSLCQTETSPALSFCHHADPLSSAGPPDTHLVSSDTTNMTSTAGLRGSTQKRPRTTAHPHSWTQIFTSNLKGSRQNETIGTLSLIGPNENTDPSLRKNNAWFFFSTYAKNLIFTSLTPRFISKMGFNHSITLSRKFKPHDT